MDLKSTNTPVLGSVPKRSFCSLDFFIQYFCGYEKDSHGFLEFALEFDPLHATERDTIEHNIIDLKDSQVIS